MATDIADYLVLKGTPFREAHAIVNQLSDYAISNDKDFSDFTFDEFKVFSNVFENDVMEIDLLSSLKSRDVFGGTAPSRVINALFDMRNKLEGYKFE